MDAVRFALGGKERGVIKLKMRCLSRCLGQEMMVRGQKVVEGGEEEEAVEGEEMYAEGEGVGTDPKAARDQVQERPMRRVNSPLIETV